MQIHLIKSKRRLKKKKTIGRGGKKGTYSGRGLKGQKARSGAKINPLFEGGRSTLTDHMKKVRGFKSPHPKKLTISIEALSKRFENGATISIANLIEKGFIGSKGEAKQGIKILGAQKIEKRFIFEKDILLTSQVAKAMGKSAKK